MYNFRRRKDGKKVSSLSKEKIGTVLLLFSVRYTPKTERSQAMSMSLGLVLSKAYEVYGY